MQNRLTRPEVPVDMTWNLNDLFTSQAHWEAECAAVDAARAQVSPYQGRLADNAQTLLQCLDSVEALQQRLMRVATYAHLRNAQDGTNPVYQAGMARVATLGAQLNASIAFVDSEILQLPDDLLEQYLAAEPGLAPYRHYLQDLLDLRPHRLSPDAERVLASLGESLAAPYMVYSRSKANDIQFAPFTDARGTVHPNSVNLFESNYEGHSDTSIRRGAWASFSAGLKSYNHTYAATFATEVNKNVVLARLRNYRSTEDFLLQSHKIPHAVYRNILDIIQAELAPHMQRYARLRRRVLGLEKLLYCDIKAPLDPAFNPRMPYDEACTLILDALAVMGPQYCGFARRALTERWVDRADNVGKSSGAFCASPYGVHPYILITWSDTMRNVFTLAHELGHGGHFGLAMQHQRFFNTRPAMPFIEAPSIMNEMLLAQHILGQSQDARMRRSVIMQVLGTYHHNFVTHLLEAELQRRAYAMAEAGKSITASVLNQSKGDILAAFWGDTVEIDDGARMTWMRQPHYYMGLYPYTYSVGLVASTAMAGLVRDEGAPAVQRWLQVLQAGGTRPPLELLQSAGIDMLSPQPIHDAVAYVGQLVDELEQGFPG
ncbi:oligoendopeptidase F [Rhodoferax sp. AJA081-3]|uniref:oligoendopeptidase F n=1 Tax=Rhodoferax sp. AJA081-3 TaxID=2752316 RepID=UPI001AE044B9|nr:oligoendopeptidase F [Rhodoferax sp. AJA081-3]QTN28873.1 oligoendopeptidase F [Rhodoferax sp. AJA081-3]